MKLKYEDYINLGFERIEMNCNVEFNRTGYRGFALEKKIGNDTMICVSSGDLNSPKLYVKKAFSETYHIIPIPTEAVTSIVYIVSPKDDSRKTPPEYLAC